MQKETKPSDTICWDCIHSVPNTALGHGCEWSVLKKPVPGWKAEEADIQQGYRVCKSYVVSGCPKFKSDQGELCGSIKMDEKANFLNLIEETIKTAIDDWNEAYDGMVKATANKRISYAIECGRVMLEVEEWFGNECNGFITRETARRVLKSLHDTTQDAPFEEEAKEYLWSRMTKDIRSATSDLVSRSEAKTMTANALRKAEYEMYTTFKHDTRLCKICRKYNPKAEKFCRPCRFDWKGKPVE